MVYRLWSMFSLNILYENLLYNAMVPTTRIKDLRVKAATSTPSEPFFGSTEESHLNFCYQLSHHLEENCETALAKVPGGGVVEIAFTNSASQPSRTINIIYRI